MIGATVWVSFHVDLAGDDLRMTGRPDAVPPLARVLLPAQFDVPDHQLWDTGYRAEARRSLLTVARTLDEATGIVRPFANPLIERTATGRWSG